MKKLRTITAAVGQYADKSIAAGFYVEDANLTGYLLATLNGW
jgi:hypothetical protein